MFITNWLPVTSGNYPGRPMTPKYITIHNTGSPGATAQQEAKYMKSTEAQNRYASWHYSVDEKDVVQSIRTDMQAWHAGDGNGPGNTESIGVEICEREGSEKNAQLLCVDLMKQYGIPIENIKQHHDWSGKDCPRIIRATPNGWENFIQGIKDIINPKEAEEVKEVKVQMNGGEITGIEVNNTVYVPLRKYNECIKIAVASALDITYTDGNPPVVKVE